MGYGSCSRAGRLANPVDPSDSNKNSNRQGMQNMKKITLGAFIAVTTLLVSTAFAGVIIDPPPSELPEPGTFGLMAMGIAGIVAAARLRRRK